MKSKLLLDLSQINKIMKLLNWYSFSLSYLFEKLGHLFECSFHLIQRIGVIPDVFYIVLLCVLFLIWIGMMRSYDKKAKDKGLID